MTQENGGLLLALGVWADLGALLIAAFLVPTAYFMHGYWRVEDPMLRANQQAHFMKNVSLAGGALALLAWVNICPAEAWYLMGAALQLSGRGRKYGCLLCRLQTFASRRPRPPR